jgi:adenylate kinase
MGLNVILMGAPGAGKGTQAGRVAKERGLPTIATGDILREAMRTPGAMAPEARARMDRGELVDDDTMIAIVRDRLWRPDAVQGFVLDGFPRTVSQAKALDGLIAERNNGPLVVVDIEVSPDELIRRLAVRRVCGTCGANANPSEPAATACRSCGGRLVQRVDDNEHVVTERLKVYAQATRPVLDYYRARPTFRVVNGAQTPDLVARQLDAMIDEAASAAQAARK